MNKNNTIKMKLAGKPFTLAIRRQLDVKTIPYLYIILILLLFNITSIILIIIFSNKLPPQVPLYYGLPRGEKQLAQPVVLILPMLLSSFFVTLNSVFTLFIKSVFLKNVLVVSGIFISILSSITVVRIIITIMGI